MQVLVTVICVLYYLKILSATKRHKIAVVCGDSLKCSRHSYYILWQCCVQLMLMDTDKSHLQTHESLREVLPRRSSFGNKLTQNANNFFHTWLI